MQICCEMFWLDLADDNFKLDENGRKSSKRLENTVGKGEIARYEQFLLFKQCFRKTYILQTRTNQGLFGKGLTLPNDKILDWIEFKILADE